MQGFIRAIRSYYEQVNMEKLVNSMKTTELTKMLLHHHGDVPSSLMKNRKGFNEAAKCHTMREKGLPNTTVSELLMKKGEEKAGSWLSCQTDDTAYDAVKQMVHNNIGSLVVLKPGQQQLIAGIFTERDFLRKVIVQDRSSKYLKVGEIMTDRDKLITVTSDTNILHAMQLMTENHIRHVPVIDGTIAGMISIGDVVRAVLEQQQGEVKRLNEFIHGDYY